MGENKKFEWEGDNLKDFYKKSIDFAIDLTFQKEMKEFDEQQSKTIPLDYEVLEYDHEEGRLHDTLGGCGCPIKSVKRLSDGEIISVGDETVHGNVSRIEVNENMPLIFYVKNDYPLYLNEVNKSKPLLFTTHDGMDVNNPETMIWMVCEDDDFKIEKQRAGYAIVFKFKKFFSEEEAKEYRLINRPLFSVQDIIDNVCIRIEGITTPFPIPKETLENLKQLAQQKINGK